MTVSIDMSEVRALAVDMRQAVRKATGETKKIVAKGALEIKKDLQGQMAGSKHFKGFARGITYDVLDGGFSAEIGPEKGKPGSGANLGYFGTSRGGGTVEDPIEALLREAPEVERRLSDLLGGLL